MSIALSENLPYPSLDGLEKDESALRLLSPAYAGGNSEMTAVLQYVYQSMLFDYYGQSEIADTLEKIAISEMRHLDLLGSAIVRLGANPVYASPLPCPCRYYSADSVNYTSSPQSMLLADIRAEREAIEGYNHVLKCSTNEIISNLVARIILDEELHLKLFKEMYGKLTEKSN